MPYLISSATGGRGYFSGSFWRADPADFNLRTRILLPPAVSAIRRKASARLYAKRLYFTGHFTENVLLDEHYRLLRQGIRAPIQLPSVSVGAGTTQQTCYLSFYDELTGERSSLSEGRAVTGNTTRTWSNLPTSVPGDILRCEGVVNKTLASAVVTGVGVPAKTNFDMFRPGDRVLFAATPSRWTTVKTITSSSQMEVDDLGIAAVNDTLSFLAATRVTHVELWVSVSGTLPRLAARVRLGTTGVVESVPTLSLGEAFLENFEPMPPGTMNAIYADRQLVAGVPHREDELFLSPLFFPERWGGLSFKTRFGEPITGVIGADDYAQVLTPESSYILQGYTEDDLTLTVSDPALGAFGHLTNLQVEANNWLPNRKNFYVFTGGAWKPALVDRQTEWNDSFQAAPRAFAEGQTVYNPNDNTVQFYPYYKSGTLPRENIWVADFSSIKFDAGGEIVQPAWMDDDYRSVLEADVNETGRQAVSHYWGYAAYLIPDGQAVGKLYRVEFPEGQIYYEDPTVAFHRDAVVKMRHELWSEEADDAGGDTIDHGWKLDKLWLGVRSEDTAWKVGVWAGDEYAAEVTPMGVEDTARINIAAPTWGFMQVAASLLRDDLDAQYLGLTVNPRRWAPKTVHPFQPKIDGRGHTIEVRFLLPKNAQFLGVMGVCIPGRASRGIVDAEWSPG